MDIKNINGEVIKTVNGNTLQNANLRSADLRSADLREADLRGADLWGVDLREADLRDANLRGAGLRGADLQGANLWGAGLQYANLQVADLQVADLRSADLRGADLRGANLRGAKVAGAKWPSPTMVLLASWGSVSDQLTLDLMRYDASNHPNPKSFLEWKKTGRCPFEDAEFERSANFTENATLIIKTFLRKKPKFAHELAKILIKEKCNCKNGENQNERNRAVHN